jgi:hypothetical protein
VGRTYPQQKAIRTALKYAPCKSVLEYLYQTGGPPRRTRKRMNELNKKYYINQVAIDRWNVNQLATPLAGDGPEMGGFRRKATPA